MEVSTVMDFIKTQTKLQPRDYQARIITKSFQAFTVEECKTVLIESPTGSGKTSLGLVLCKLLEDEFGWTFGWVAMRRKLLLQAMKENENIGVKRIHFVSLFDKNPPKCDFMITDEAQHDAARICGTMHKEMGAKYSLGLTATPFRTDRIKLAYEKVVNDCGIRFLVEQGYLSPFEQYGIPDFSPETLAKNFIREKERWGKSVIYLINKGLCYDLDARLKKAGVKSSVILGDTPPGQQDDIFTAFEEGETQVLINIYLLTEGFDSPDLKTVWVRDSGRLCTTQMAGRVLRKDPNNPNKIAQVVQSTQTERSRWSFTKTAQAKREFIRSDDDTEWRGLEPGPQVTLISLNVREKLLTKPVELPEFLFRGSNTMKLGKKGRVIVTKRVSSKKESPLAFMNKLDEGIDDQKPEVQDTREEGGGED